MAICIRIAPAIGAFGGSMGTGTILHMGTGALTPIGGPAFVFLFMLAGQPYAVTEFHHLSFGA